MAKSKQPDHWRNRIVGYGEMTAAELEANPRNPRIHPPDQQAAMGQMLSSIGYVAPIVVNKTTGLIVDGHMRVDLAAARGEAIPVAYVELSAEEEAEVLALMDPVGAMAQYDPDRLAELAMEFDMDAAYRAALAGLLQFDDDDGLGDLDVDPDEVPPVPKRPRTKPGDVWVLGDHRLVCGNATSSVDLAKLMDGGTADMVWTDPPYNVDVEGAAGKIMNDSLTADEFSDLLNGSMRLSFQALRPGGPIYVAHSETERLAFTKAFVDAGFKLQSALVWRKHSMTLGRSDYQWQHEPILYGWKPGAAHRWYGGRKQTTILAEDGPLGHPQPDGSWLVDVDGRLLLIRGTDLVVQELEGSVLHHDRPSRSDDHPTMKPVGLVTRAILNSSEPGDVVLDLFGGSGTTLIAAHLAGRAARLMELDARFCDVICRRFQEVAGVTPVLTRTGKAVSFVR